MQPMTSTAPVSYTHLAYHGRKEVDLRGKYVCPGLIDGHIHIESSMLCGPAFEQAVLPLSLIHIFSGQNTAYLMERGLGMLKRIQFIGNNYQIIHDPSEVPEEITKVSVYLHEGVESYTRCV